MASRLKQHLRPAQAAARTGISLETIRKMTRDGRLPAIHVGRIVLIPESAVAALLSAAK